MLIIVIYNGLWMTLYCQNKPTSLYQLFDWFLHHGIISRSLVEGFYYLGASCRLNFFPRTVVDFVITIGFARSTFHFNSK